MTTSFKNDQGTGFVESDGFVGPVAGVVTASAGSTFGGNAIRASKYVPITIVDGAAAGTFAMPTGAVIQSIDLDTPTTIPGTPTNVNLRLGSSANGQQYVADVDVKTQGWIVATTLYAARRPATTVHYTVASSGGTAGSQDGTIYVFVNYVVPA